MFVRRVTRSGEILIAGAVLSLAFITTGHCQSVSESDPEPEALPETEETIEEILVYGDKSLGTLRQEVYDAEDAFLDHFNVLNSDDDLDIHCYREARIGSRLRRRVCKPNYLIRLEAEATADMMLMAGTGRALSYLEPVARIRKMDKKMQEEMQKLAAENPELLEALREAANKKLTYQKARKEKCEGRLIVCR